MTKTAANLIKLLSRVGPNLRGATGRELKFLARRGLAGFKPQTVATLRSRGMLPSVDQELAGANRGTLNMFGWTPKSNGGHVLGIDPTVPLRKLDQKNLDTLGYRSDLSSRTAAIPDLSDASGTLQDRATRSLIGRHEAREWVRGNAAFSKGRNPHLPGHRGGYGDFFTEPEIGSSHFPGVIHDERIFHNQMLNRLGLTTPWSQASLGTVQGFPMRRGLRDLYVGEKPLPYEFARVNEWRRQQAADRALVKSVTPSRDAQERAVSRMIDGAQRRSDQLQARDPVLRQMDEQLKSWGDYATYESTAARRAGLEQNLEAEYAKLEAIREAKAGRGPYADYFSRINESDSIRRIADLQTRLGKIVAKPVPMPEGYSRPAYEKMLDDWMSRRAQYPGGSVAVMGDRSAEGIPAWTQPYRQAYDNLVTKHVARALSRRLGRAVTADEIARVLERTTILRRSPELQRLRTMPTRPADWATRFGGFSS